MTENKPKSEEPSCLGSGALRTSMEEASPRKRKVRCADCAYYMFYEPLKDVSSQPEPLGGCENDDILAYAVVMDYTGRNWRLNQRNSNTLRYCKGFKQKGKS